MESFKRFLNLERLKRIFKKEYDLGRKGEKIALKYLKKSGFEIIESGFRALRGEIDIIAKEKDTIVFVEVKTRTSYEFGTPLEAVDFKKQAQIKKIASIYISKKFQKFIPCRFDVIGIIMNKKGEPEISHIRNAF